MVKVYLEFVKIKMKFTFNIYNTLLKLVKAYLTKVICSICFLLIRILRFQYFLT